MRENKSTIITGDLNRNFPSADEAERSVHQISVGAKQLLSLWQRVDAIEEALRRFRAALPDSERSLADGIDRACSGIAETESGMMDALSNALSNRPGEITSGPKRQKRKRGAK